MKKNFLHILSETSCIIKINDCVVGEIDNNTNMEIDIISQTPQMYLSYNPVCTDAPTIPFTTLIHTNNAPICNNENVKIIPFPNNHFDILLTPFYYYHTYDTKTLFNNTIGKYFLSIIADNINTKIILYSGMSIVYTLNTIPLQNVKVSSHSEYILIQGVTLKQRYYAIIINTSTFATIYDDYITSLDEQHENITILKSCGTLCHHAQVINIQTATKKIDKYYVFEKDQTRQPFNPYILPKAFFECLQVQDENTLKSFFTQEYHDATLPQFAEYFGSIKEFYLNRHQQTPYNVNYTILSDSYHNYTFHIDNNLITEIEEIF